MRRKVSVNRSRKRPFWLPATSYYFLAVAVAVGVFFLVWAILAETQEENPWITAGLFSSVTMISAVVVREVILRYRRETIALEQRRLDQSLLSARSVSRHEPDATKLTLERNAYLVAQIVRKSEAASVLGKLAESHREVFELCERYIEVATKELAKVNVGSPRLAAITRGRSKAERLHRHHMMQWAEIEVGSNSLAASESERNSVRLEKARKALRALNTVGEYYPHDPSVVESREALEQFILSARIKAAIERAERAEERGDVDRAMESLYEADRLMQRAASDGLDDSLVKIKAKLESLLGRTG